MTGQQVSSPAATGGAGTFFEQHVAAYWLAQLLVQSVPPILIETVVTEVDFQTEHLGWQTDDFLVVCEGSETDTHKLAGQVKRTFTVSSTDEDCKRAIQDFWKDYKSPDRFSQQNDRLLLVTLRGTETLLRHFVGLLDCARAAADGTDFERRLATKGFVSEKTVHYCGEIQKIVGEVEGQVVTPGSIWPFLRVLHVLSLDLDSSTRQTEAQVKSLLAHTVTVGDKLGAANASWNALLVLASTAIPEARRMRWVDLPQDLRQRHALIGASEQVVLRALKDHTALILRGIRSTIGQDLHLQRSALVQKVLDELETTQVVLVSGPAGSGKSAVGKDSVALISHDHFTFGFRVEEFAQSHLDATLHAAQIPATGGTLGAILAPQGWKVVLVESVERLLERTTRDAFSDLMTLAAADQSMRIVLTCRDYSIEQVRASFLNPAGIKHATVKVPPLDDAELLEVEAAFPTLKIPLKNPALRNILRNPYFLDKALAIPWSTKAKLPESEREFRTLFWREIVRADQRGPAGMARRREEVFQEIAVRRARALAPYVPSNALDPAVISGLRQDSLIASPEGNPLLVAPAHDVLEDWAILQWLEEQHVTGDGSFRALSAAIGAHPAIRRSYRKWIAELIERDPPAADRVFRAALTEADISAQFRDDTLVSLLRALPSHEFLLRHEAELVANDRALLKRLIHLLRVACVTTPAWLAGAAGHGSVFNVPDGPAWVPALMLVQRNLATFAPQERLLLLGLIEDAVRNVSWWQPDLEGAEVVASIAHFLLASFDDYRSGKLRKRTLQVVARIPKADAGRFEAVLRGTARGKKQWDANAEDLRELIFAGTDGMPAARDLPDLVMSVAVDYILASEEDVRRDRYSPTRGDVETYFGIREGLRHDFFPPSAVRGPWVPLLQHHPVSALDFFIRVFNHSADWYVHPRLSDPLEPAWEIDLTFADGSTRKQWGNPRLWNLYRGTSVGPYVLQCMLMAIEKWLLDYARRYPQDIDRVLVDLLRRSDSAALAAVVASVATAYPHASGEALLVLLSAPDYIAFDRGRMVGEHHSSFMGLGTANKVHEEERKEASQLPHRHRDLEAAIADLQLGSLASRVHAIFDQQLAGLQGKSEQDPSDLRWRLAIHRMDLRQYTISAESEAEPSEAGKSDAVPAKRYIKLEPKAPAPELQALVDQTAALYAPVRLRLGILMWGVQTFERANGTYDPSRWREVLAEARTVDRDTEQPDGGQHGPGFVASVCVRDHWEEMTIDEQGWCTDVVIAEVQRQADQWDDVERMQRFSMAADRPCARVISLLLGKPLTQEKTLRVRETLVAALTHPIEEVRSYAAAGIDRQFWVADHALAMRCVNAIATDAALIDAAIEAETRRPYQERRRVEEIAAEAASIVRQNFWTPGGIAEDAHKTLDISAGFGAEASLLMLSILGEVPQDEASITAFARASQTLVDWWNSDDDRKGSNRRNFHTEAAMSERLQKFVMQTTPVAAEAVLRAVLDAIERHPREVGPLIQGLIGIEDSRPNTSQFWFLWELFANGVRRAKWVARLGDEHPSGSEMLAAIFLTAYWKDNVRHWRSVEGYEHHVHALFDELPPSAIVLDSYVRFLYHIGERSLPEAFVRVANSLKRGDAQGMLRMSNTVFLLEVLLQRHVYGRPLELKRDPAIRDAVLFLLDVLVENGSSAAFLMRDDFVTPAS